MQAREVMQVREIRDLLRHDELRHGPQVTRVDDGRRRLENQVSHILLKGAVRKRDLLHNTDDQIVGLRQRADKPVVADGNGGNMRGACGEGDRLCIGRVRRRGVLLRHGYIDRSARRRDRDRDIIREFAAVRRQCWGCRAGRLQRGANGRVRDAVEHLLGIKQLVLRHIGRAQAAVELLRGGRADGFHKRALRARVAAVSQAGIRKRQHIVHIVRRKRDGRRIAVNRAGIVAALHGLLSERRKIIRRPKEMIQSKEKSGQ